MNEHAANKRVVADFLAEMAEADIADIETVLRRRSEPGAVWRIFHPFDAIEGYEAVARLFWRPLKEAFPDHEQRLGLVIGGEYEGRACVSTLGHLQGNFARPWLGIPPTHGLAFLRFGFNATVRDGRITSAYLLFDLIDLMRQAGFYPLRRMPGSAEQWPMPPAASGATIDGHDAIFGAETLRIVHEMQNGLAGKDELGDLAKLRNRHSPHWHRDMNWYGPAGIGSSRGQKGFLDYHGALFIQAFPDRSGIARALDGEEARPGSYMSVGDGRFAVTAGWPLMRGTHLGGGWLGVPPSGREVTMRVADWYRTDANDKLIDNWVMIDVPHMLAQFGLDILEDVRFFADPSLPRWPV